MKDKYELIIFDVGGVLRDSSKAGSEAFRRGFLKEGLEYNFNDIDTFRLRGFKEFHKSINTVKALYCLEKYGHSLDEILNNREEPVLELEHIISSIKLDEDDLEKLDRINLEYKVFFHSPDAKNFIDLYPNVQSTLKKLSESDIDLAIVTNSTKESVLRDLVGIDIRIFKEIIAAEDGDCEKKPSSDGIYKTSEKLSVALDKILFVGDSEVDIISAKNAPVDIAAVTYGMGVQKYLAKLDPTYTLNDISEILNIL